MADMDLKRGAGECAHAPETPVGDPLEGVLGADDPYVLLDGVIGGVVELLGRLSRGNKGST